MNFRWWDEAHATLWRIADGDAELLEVARQSPPDSA
jgi:hypothetical protein